MNSTTTPTTKKKCKSLFKKLVRNDDVAVEAVHVCPPNTSLEERLDAAMEMCDDDDDN
jgi:transcription initiation factor IIE alpha subunit